MHVEHLVPLTAGTALVATAALALAGDLLGTRTGSLTEVVNAVRIGDDRFVIGRTDDGCGSPSPLDGSDVDRDREAFATAAVPADAIRSVDSGNTADRLANRSRVAWDAGL